MLWSTWDTIGVNQFDVANDEYECLFRRRDTIILRTTASEQFPVADIKAHILLPLGFGSDPPLQRPTLVASGRLLVRTTFGCLQANEVFEVAKASDDDYLSFIFAKRLDLDVGVSQELPIGIIGTGFVRDGL